MAPPFRQAEFEVIYGEGISKVGELIDLGVAAGIVEKSGAWYSYGPERIGQGKEKAKQFLRDDPQTALAIESAIRQDADLAVIEAPAESDFDPVVAEPAEA